MPRLSGIETARELLKNLPSAKIMLLSLHDTKAMVEEALNAGVRGYLTKELASRNIVDAVLSIHAGRYYLCPSIAHFVIQSGLEKKVDMPGERAKTQSPLTGQERKVLQLIAEGHSNKEIAALLNLSANTVHAHRNSTMAKLNIHKQADLVRYAIKAGIAKL
jgi:DNA-binding NarL/FixJ family response regulator